MNSTFKSLLIATALSTTSAFAADLPADSAGAASSTGNRLGAVHDVVTVTTNFMDVPNFLNFFHATTPLNSIGKRICSNNIAESIAIAVRDHLPE